MQFILCQVCPPIEDYPLIYTGRENLQCSFPEALKFVEQQCHGQELCSINTAPEVFRSPTAR